MTSAPGVHRRSAVVRYLPPCFCGRSDGRSRRPGGPRMGNVHVDCRRRRPAPSNGCRSRARPTCPASSSGSSGIKGLCRARSAWRRRSSIFTRPRDDGKRGRPVPAGNPHGVVPAAAGFPRNHQRRFRGEIAWTSVKVVPGAARFRVEGEREPLLSRAQHRCVAAPGRARAGEVSLLSRRRPVPPPISARVAQTERSSSATPAAAPLGDIMLFENRGGVIAYQTRRTSATVRTRPPRIRAKRRRRRWTPAGSGRAWPLSEGSEGDGRKLGWFLVRARHTPLLHRLGRGIDAMFPLQMSRRPPGCAGVRGPARDCHAATRREVKDALEKDDRQELAQYGRFLEPMAKRSVSDLPGSERSGDRAACAGSVRTRRG